MRKRNQQRGSAFVEFALLAVLLSAGVTGAMSIGWNAYIYDALVTRVTTRYASRLDCAGTSGVPGYESAVRNFIVYGNPAGGTSSTVPRLATSNVIVNLDRTASPGLVTVSISGVSLGIGAMGLFHFNQPSLCEDELCRVLFLNEGSSRAVATECSRGS